MPRPVHLFVGRIAVENNLPAFLDLELSGSKVVVGGGPPRDGSAMRTCQPDLSWSGSAPPGCCESIEQIWVQVSERYCGSADDIADHNTRAEAEAACQSDDACLSISDGACDGSGTWETCRSSSGSSSSSGSCLYLQTLITI